MRFANYLICTHPRSGSNYLCELLSSTGVLGNPAEYFHEGNLQQAGLTSRKAEDLRGRFETVIQDSRTQNGVIGIKLFHFDLPALQKAGLLARLGGFKFVFLRRQDKLAQAISIRKALLTGHLTSDHPSSGAPLEYDYEDIKLRILRTIRAEREWQAFFQANAITPLPCLYEKLVASPQPAVDAIAKAVGISSEAPIDKGRLRLKVQRDSLSGEWRDRFLADAARLDPDLHRYCADRLSPQRA